MDGPWYLPSQLVIYPVYVALINFSEYITLKTQSFSLSLISDKAVYGTSRHHSLKGMEMHLPWRWESAEVCLTRERMASRSREVLGVPWPEIRREFSQGAKVYTDLCLYSCDLQPLCYLADLRNLVKLIFLWELTFGQGGRKNQDHSNLKLEW